MLSIAPERHSVPKSTLTVQSKGFFMADKNTADLPPIGEIYEHWLTTKQAAEIIGMSVAGVAYLCAKKKIRAVKIGSERRGEWRIDPDAARQYIRRKP